MEATEPEPTISETSFTTKQACIAHVRPFYEAQLGRPLAVLRGGANYNEYKFTLVCNACRRKVVSAFCSRSTKTDNTFTLTCYNLPPKHMNQELMQMCEPTGKKKSTIKELSETAILNVIVNDISLAKGAHKGMSTEAKKALLALGGHGNVTTSAIKHATALLKVTPSEHIQSYNHMIPYFARWKVLNPKLCYSIEPKDGGVFQRLAVVMPYTSEFLPNMLNVFGLDAGFMPEIPIKGNLFVLF